MAITNPGYNDTLHYNNYYHYNPLRKKYNENTSTNTHRATRNDIRTAENGFMPYTSNDNSLAVTPTNVFIFSNGAIVGMIQSFTINESRNINKLWAIGWEGVVQAVPDNTKGGTLNVSRIALYESYIWNALGLTTNGYPFHEVGAKVFDNTTADADWDISTLTKSELTSALKVKSNQVFKTLKDQRVPLEIQVKTKARGGTEDYWVETYIDCWLSSYKRSYSVGTITVGEDVTIMYGDVY